MLLDPIDVLDQLEEFLSGMGVWCDQDGLESGEQLARRGAVAHSVSHETVVKMRRCVTAAMEALEDERLVKFPDDMDCMSYLTFRGCERLEVV